MKLMVISFATEGPYEEHSRCMEASAEEFDITVFAGRYPACSWLDAVTRKPTFILDCMLSASITDAFLWVDADARFRQQPDFSIFEDCDYSACLFQWTAGHPLEMLTGTLFFRNTPEVREMVRHWIAMTETWRKANHDTPEQIALLNVHQMYEREKRGLRFKAMPPEWVFVEPEFRTRFDGLKPVISHLQASRTLRGAK